MSSELSTSSALVAKARFVGHGVSQIMADRDKFFWHGLAFVGVRSGGALFWYKCLGPMNTFVKYKTTRVVPALESIK